MTKDFLSVLDFTRDDLQRCLELSRSLKQQRIASRGRPRGDLLAGAHVALLFEKPSLRTRSTFEIAIRELGGHVLEPQRDCTFGERESLKDVVRNLERWVAGLVIRTFSHDQLVQVARTVPRVPVINALSDEQHPCQALADVFTLAERWSTFRDRTIAFVGDGNNVAASLAHVSALVGLNLRVSSPEGYDLPAARVHEARDRARDGTTIELVRDPAEAVRGVDAVYTDAWTSMGQEDTAAERQRAFAGYQVNTTLMRHAAPDALFMHCLPAHRGEEVTDEVIDSPASIVFDQAENRLHTQKALLAMLLAID